MKDHPNLRLSVENFGPIVAGEVETRPLTVLIGPNNSGKSYLAQLFFALSKALSGSFRRPVDLGPSFDDYLDRQLRDATEQIPFAELPEERQRILRMRVELHLATMAGDVDESLRRYFAFLDHRELVRDEDQSRSIVVTVNPAGDSKQFIKLKIDANGLSMSETLTDLIHADVPLSAGPTLSPMSEDTYTLGLIARHLWSQVLRANGFPEGSAYYLPSARSGIMAGLEAYTTAAIDRVWRAAGREPITIAPFPGVAGDFLQIMVSSLFRSDREPVVEEPMQAAVELLEGSVLRGRIRAGLRGVQRLLIEYETAGMTIPIQRTSAMIAELAPLDLWLKQLLRPGDLLIIDEPEAHLHPDNQRLIARVLVRLVRAGIRVICPTHSSLILNQISNHLLATQLSTLERTSMGYTDDDLLGLDEVAVYLFEPSSDGTRIKPVTIEPDWGISEQEFLRVSEAIGAETSRLSTAYDQMDATPR